jgi:hypothetical protein
MRLRGKTAIITGGAEIFLTPEPGRIHSFDKDGKAVGK